MTTSKFVNLDPNVLLEWIYDDENFLAEDYQIVVNTVQSTRGFVNSETTNTLPSTTNNYVSTNLFELDASNNVWAPIDASKYSFLQVISYPGNVPYRYDIVRIHFPINYNFGSKLGFLLNINVLDRTGKVYLNLSNFYFDKTDSSRSLELTAPPFLYNEMLWGKYLEISVPAPVALANDVQQSGVTSAPVPNLGGINSNLAGPAGLGVGPNSSIFIDYSFLLQKNVTPAKVVSYMLQDPFSVAIPQVPEFQSLSVVIRPSSEGDWFEIFGAYENTATGFATFISQQALNGNPQYAIYTVTTFEKNLETDTVQYVVQDNFDTAIRYRPIITFSTTTAVLDVQMQLINSQTGNFVTRTTSYVMLQDQVAKYSRVLTKINLSNAFVPKLYQSAPDNITLNPIVSSASTQTVKVPYPVMYDRFNVVAKNVTETVNDETFYGMGQLQILLYPTDNILRFVIAKTITSNGYQPFVIPTGTPITLTFKSDTLNVDSALYTDTNQVDYSQGVLVFRVLQTQSQSIQTIYKAGFDQFYIIMQTNGVNTVLYSGRFLLFSQF